MSVKETVRFQIRRQINGVAGRFEGLTPPRDGWIASFRKALGMNGPQMARRAGVTKAAIYQAERKEAAGEITINQLQRLAGVLGGKLVYAIVPEDGTVEDIVRRQAEKQAAHIITTADTHMALEAQALGQDANQAAMNRLADELERNPPSDFWEEK